MAVLDRISFKRRAQRPLSTARPSRWDDLVAVVLGLAAYVVFVLWLHPRLIGVPVPPG